MKKKFVAASVLAILLAFGQVGAQTLKEVKSAKVQNPVNLVVVSEAYRPSDLPRFPQDVKGVVVLEELKRFDTLADSVRVFTLEVASRDTGISSPGKPRDTFLGAYLNPEAYPNSILLPQAGLNKLDGYRIEFFPGQPPERIVFLVLVNSGSALATAYEYSGVAIVTAKSWNSAGASSHELGHVLGYNPKTGRRVVDEYWAPSLYEEPFVDSSFANITRKTSEELSRLDLSRFKWGSAVELPPPFPNQWVAENRGKVGIFSVVQSPETDIRIPSMSCKMGNAARRSFCKVCRRAISEAVAARMSTAMPILLVGDFDGNGVVDFEDFFLFAAAFGGKDARFDLSKSGAVDFDDFFLFAENFGKKSTQSSKPAVRLAVPGCTGPRISHSDPELEGLNGQGQGKVNATEEGKSFSLSQNYPNPFNPATQIVYRLPADTHVRLKVYNLLGQEIMTLVDRPQTAGDYLIRWDGKDSFGRSVASGMYLYRLDAGKFSSVKRMTLLK